MKKIIVILGCAAVLLSACGKKDNQNKTDEQQQVQEQTATDADNAVQNAIDAALQPIDSDVDEEPLPPAKYVEDEITKKIDGDTKNLEAEFAKLSDAQQYYFCAAFAMGAMSAAKPITASVMVNYFMGLGVAKYNVGINDETYMAFNAGKNVFLHENLVNKILENKSCENVISDAMEYAKKQQITVEYLDELGQVEVEKAVKYIQAEE
ncbi:MAG: hypothetical protein IKR92_03045 [Alphaproteobacteria bacterium]|nr:hypothetical protein [Alphaproteobacteria bacterium]